MTSHDKLKANLVIVLTLHITMFSYTYDKNDKNLYKVYIWKIKRINIYITIGGQTCHTCHKPVLSMVYRKFKLVIRKKGVIKLFKYNDWKEVITFGYYVETALKRKKYESLPEKYKIMNKDVLGIVDDDFKFIPLKFNKRITRNILRDRLNVSKVIK